VAASAKLEERVEALEGKISGSTGRQDMFAGNLTEIRDTVKRTEATVDQLAESQRDTQAWQNITDNRQKSMGKDILGIKSDVAKLNLNYDDLSTRVGDLNTKYERLDRKVERLDKKVGGLDRKVGDLDQKVEVLGKQFGVLAEDVGGLTAGQIELRDMVATLLARSEGVEKPKP
jgi:chromosome segregation ATPase